MKLRESNKLSYRICINTVGFRKMLINNNKKLSDMEDNLNFTKWEINCSVDKQDHTYPLSKRSC